MMKPHVGLCLCKTHRRSTAACVLHNAALQQRRSSRIRCKSQPSTGRACTAHPERRGVAQCESGSRTHSRHSSPGAACRTQSGSVQGESPEHAAESPRFSTSPGSSPENSAMGVAMRCRGYCGGAGRPYTRQLQRCGRSQGPQHHPPQSYFCSSRRNCWQFINSYTRIDNTPWINRVVEVSGGRDSGSGGNAQRMCSRCRNCRVECSGEAVHAVRSEVVRDKGDENNNGGGQRTWKVGRVSRTPCAQCTTFRTLVPADSKHYAH